MISTNKQAFLLLCNHTTDTVIETYKEIYEASKKCGDAFILYHLKGEKLPDKIKKLKHFTFTDSILTQLNYLPIGFSLIPGNNHFPLLQFYLDTHPIYDYYWCIEEDVRFNGDWKYFFDFFSSITKDFISCHIRTFSEEPQWHWWSTLAHPNTFIPFEERIRSFNPIYRISKAALGFIHQALLEHWCGHHEVLLPTLLNQTGFEIMDFGGEGKFVLPGFENKFYINNTVNKYGNLLDGSMRWRPVFKFLGSEENKLYHPVKLCDY